MGGWRRKEGVDAARLSGANKRTAIMRGSDNTVVHRDIEFSHTGSGITREHVRQRSADDPSATP